MKQPTEGAMAGRQRWLWLLWSGRRRKHGRGVLSHRNGCQTARFHAQHSCDAKPTLLEGKRAAFRMQNNRFCNALTTSRLRDNCICGKYLQSIVFFSFNK